MGKKMSDGDKLILIGLGAIGVIGLYYLTAGYDRENNAAFIPDALENRIDRVVDALNTKVGKNWVTWGAGQLKSYLRNALPPSLVALVDVAYVVEQEARRVGTAGHTKRQRAVSLATARGLA
ncbi:MAG TPA: hypothetical protein VE732_07260 [Nitrososphaera sp.]|nr:hypothetical protein [Nitrososphaera sp.]